MKKALSLILALVLTIGMCACSQVINEKEQLDLTSKNISVGEKVTVGEFSFKIDSISLEDYYERQLQALTDSDNDVYIVSLVVYNESRKNELILPELTLNYDNGYDTHSFVPERQYHATSWYSFEDIPAQESQTFVFLGDVPEIQSEDTTSSKVLEITFMSEKFTLNVDCSEISLEGAIKAFTKEKGQEYFKKHMEEFPVLTTAEIQKTFSNQKMDIIEVVKNGQYWQGKFEFESDGRIRETMPNYNHGISGYYNNRSWSVRNDTIILNQNIVCEVRKINNSTYLLVKNGTPYILAS